MPSAHLLNYSSEGKNEKYPILLKWEYLIRLDWGVERGDT